MMTLDRQGCKAKMIKGELGASGFVVRSTMAVIRMLGTLTKIRLKCRCEFTNVMPKPDPEPYVRSVDAPTEFGRERGDIFQMFNEWLPTA